jgi:hypothetical protein
MTMTSSRELPDAMALEALSQLSTEIRERKLVGAEKAAQSPAEARELLSQFIGQYCGIDIAPEAILPEGSPAGSQARETLAVLADDPDTRDFAQELLNQPPQPGQKTIEFALGAAIVLGSLVTWLQTKIDIEVARGANGKARFRFALRKDAANSKLIQSLAESVGRLVGKEYPARIRLRSKTSPSYLSRST